MCVTELPFPQYAFMALLSVKHRDNVTFIRRVSSIQLLTLVCSVTYVYSTVQEQTSSPGIVLHHYKLS